ncbi:MAG: DMT family transporter [Marinifilaceae bacterium]|jgi:transporter family-2 protein|nr:DMT family transporter [Marinifilaceae bacterium]
MNNMNYLFLILAIVIGALNPIQATVNSSLSKWMNHPLQATFFSFLGGFVLIVLINIVFAPNFPSFSKLTQIPWYLYVGGVFGVLFVTAFLLLVRQLGATTLVAGAFLGQIVMSLLIDSFGWFGIQPIELSMKRIIGAALLVLGTILVQK